MKDFRELNEEVSETTNAAGAGNIAGLPPDSPPGPRKKKKWIVLIIKCVMIALSIDLVAL